jgi:hypothetical protein
VASFAVISVSMMPGQTAVTPTPVAASSIASTSERPSPHASVRVRRHVQRRRDTGKRGDVDDLPRASAATIFGKKWQPWTTPITLMSSVRRHDASGLARTAGSRCPRC